MILKGGIDPPPNEHKREKKKDGRANGVGASGRKPFDDPRGHNIMPYTRAIPPAGRMK